MAALREQVQPLLVANPLLSCKIAQQALIPRGRALKAPLSAHLGSAGSSSYLSSKNWCPQS